MRLFWGWSCVNKCWNWTTPATKQRTGLFCQPFCLPLMPPNPPAAGVKPHREAVGQGEVFVQLLTTRGTEKGGFGAETCCVESLPLGGSCWKVGTRQPWREVRAEIWACYGVGCLPDETGTQCHLHTRSLVLSHQAPPLCHRRR